MRQKSRLPKNLYNSRKSYWSDGWTEVTQTRAMPQVDTATFYPIVSWTFIVYTGGYLVLSLTSLFTFIAATKIVTRTFGGAGNRRTNLEHFEDKQGALSWLSV